MNYPQSLRLLSLCFHPNAEARPSAFLNLWGTMLLQFIFSVYVDLGSSVKFTLQGLIGTFLAYLSLGPFSSCRKTGGANRDVVEMWCFFAITPNLIPNYRVEAFRSLLEFSFFCSWAPKNEKQTLLDLNTFTICALSLDCMQPTKKVVWFLVFCFQCSCHLWLNRKNARETLKKKNKILTSEQVIYNFIARGSLIMRKKQQVSGNRLAWDIPKWVAVNCSRSTLHFFLRTQENIERTRQTIT